MKPVVAHVGRFLTARGSTILIGLAVLLFTFGAVRSASSFRTRTHLESEVSMLISDLADLEDVAFSDPGVSETEREKYLDGAIPFGDVPGPILDEILATLDALGIRDYEYQVRERARTVDVVEPMDGEDPDSGDDYSQDEPSAAWGAGDWNGPDESEDRSSSIDRGAGDASPECTPGLSLYQWKINLVLRTPYSRVARLLETLAGTPRHWRVSEVRFTRMGPLLQATLRLETFTRPTQELEDKVPGEAGPFAFGNPFEVEVGIRRSGGTHPVAEPTLRAVMSGPTPRAWLDERILRTGESVEPWTVEEIDDNGVWIRHTSGRRVRLSVAG